MTIQLNIDTRSTFDLMPWSRTRPVIASAHFLYPL